MARAFFFLLLLYATLCSAVIASGSAKNRCGPLCWDCNDDGTCAGCDDGSMLVNGTCRPCTDTLCAVCGPSPGTCKQCAEFVSDLRPNAKPDFAIYRAANGQCKECNQPRSSGVVGCDARGRATKCDNGFALSIVGGVPRCVQCKSGGSFCATCDPKTLICRACQDSYGFNPLGVCVPCRDTRCSVCRDFRSCDRCLSSYYYLDPTTKTCKTCNTRGCDFCNPDGTCKRCYDFGYVQVGNKCISCPSGCDTCTPALVCTKCSSGYFLAGGKCQECARGCDKCTSKNVCTKCYSLSLINGRCTRCSDPRCDSASCPGNPGKALRPVRDICRKCAVDGYHVDPATSRCVPVSGTPSAAAAKAAAAAAGGGDGVSSQIVGGYDAQRGRYPWMASLRVNSKADAFRHNCGATLVHERVLLTAAHCLVGGSGDWRDMTYVFYQVRLGGYETNGGTYQLREGAWPLVHPAFDGDTSHGHDFALILLDRPAAQGTPLIQLPAPGGPDPPVAPGTVLYAIGWGNLGYEVDDNQAKNLREARPPLLGAPLKLLTKAACQFHFNDANLATQLCAGKSACRVASQPQWQGGGAGAGAGQGGGPLFVKGKTNATDLQYLVREAESGRIPGVPGKAAGR
ncbi:hypothetical protein ABPG77_006273 [Micractinium sp. CCAP 211/92]